MKWFLIFVFVTPAFCAPNIVIPSTATFGEAQLLNGEFKVQTPAVYSDSAIQLVPVSDAPDRGTLFISERLSETSFTVKSTSLTDTRRISWAIVDPIKRQPSRSIKP